MEATLIDRNFEFRPRNLGNYVKATIGVVCDTEEQLLLLLQHLGQLDLVDQYNNTKEFVDPAIESQENAEAKSIKDALAEYQEKGSIGSLEL
jgi:hypothetical protein